MGTCRMAARVRNAGLALLLTFAVAHPAASQALTGATSGQMPEAAQQEILATYGKLPLRFEANRGQTDAQVHFLARGSGYTLYLTAGEAVLVLRSGQANRPGVLRMKLVGANPAPRVAGLEQLAGTAHYFIGNDPKAWRTAIPAYAKVEYRDVYPGVSLVYYGNEGALEYDFVLAPGADPGAIRVAFEGATNLQVDSQGDLVLQTARGEVRQRKPVIYQEVNGVRREISGGYVLTGRDQVAFQLAAYDASRPLVIDPVLTYSTYLGGSGFFEEGKAIAVDGFGNAYVVGQSDSFDFPAPGGTPPTFGGGSTDAFVAKLDASGALVYTAYLGGNSDDSGFGVAVDASGYAYVTGLTFSTDFPRMNPLQSVGGGSFSDAFVTKLNPAGGLVYSTYLGGSGFDEGRAIAVDASGNAYVTGVTFSPFPTLNPFQAGFGGGSDAFVAKLNATGMALVYSTYLGGSGSDAGLGVAVDGTGNAYVTGRTDSSNFPTANAFQALFGGGTDAFVAKFNTSGGRDYSTYLGGSGTDEGRGIAVDGSGYAYVAGSTDSPGFATAGAFQAGPPLGKDAFVAKLNATGTARVYSTYLGGSGDDEAIAIAVGGSGNAYVTGRTSGGFPTTPDAVQSEFGGTADAFVTKLNAAGSAPLFSTYLGGGGDDAGRGIAVDGSGNAYVTGDTMGYMLPSNIFSNDFPTVNPSQPVFGGGLPGSEAFGTDAFVAKVEIPQPVPPVPQVVPFLAFRMREFDLDKDDAEFGRDAFKAEFTLGAGHNGINPVTEDVTIRVGNASVTIPAGSFGREGRRWKYKGQINGVKVKVSIRPSGRDGDGFRITFKGEDANEYRQRRHEQRSDHVRGWWSKRRPGPSSEIMVALTIGNDGGCIGNADGCLRWRGKARDRGKRDRDGDRDGRRGRGRGGDQDD